MPPRSKTTSSRPSRGDPARGQASAELVAVVPLIVVAALVTGQLVVAGYALWSAGLAARAGARAEHVGGDPRAAARSALPAVLRRGARIEAGDSIEVRVGAPALVPGLPAVAVGARARLEPDPGER